MSIETQKEIAKEVLYKLEAIDPHCILAGGAPRNWFFNKEANDLDFYIHLDETMEATKVRFERVGLELTHIAFDSEKWIDYGVMKHLFRIYEGVYKGQEVQVMVMKEPTFTSVVPCFGVSLCMFWWKGKEVVPTNEALMSVLTRTLYIKDDYSAKEVHVEKMLNYFPEYMVGKFSWCKTFVEKEREKMHKAVMVGSYHQCEDYMYHNYFMPHLLKRAKEIT